MNKIYQKAINYSHKDEFTNDRELATIRNTAFRSFYNGAYYMLEEAVEWLRKNADGYTWHNPVKGESGMYDDFVDTFKNAMEQE